MAAITFEHVSFTYPDQAHPILQDISFSVESGEFILLCGETGSGKTSLLRCIKREIAPVGRYEGSITILNQPRDFKTKKSRSIQVGFVAQHPDNQLVMDTVWHELAFGLENLGLPSHIIRRRMAETANFFGIEDWIQKKVSTLSGGQKQILNLASVMAMQPQILILDEPTAQLDPIAAKEFLQICERIHKELGTTILMSEHRLEDVLPLSDRVFYMKNGALLYQENTRSFVPWLQTNAPSFSPALPASTRVAKLLGEREDFPINVREGRDWLKRHSVSLKDKQFPEETKGTAVLKAKELWFRYDREEDFVIRDASLSIFGGEIHAILGGNGSGKTTLMQLLCGVLKPARGKIWQQKGLRIGLLTQNPMALFTADTVYEELCECLYTKQYGKEEIEQILDTFSLSAYRDRHPYDLSGGEMQKLALAKILLLSPDILLLDEPTKGIDAVAKEEFQHILLSLKEQGKTILLVTHDIEFAASISDRCSMIFDGGISCTDEGRAFFSSNLFYTTETNRMLRSIAQNYIIPKDVVS